MLRHILSARPTIVPFAMTIPTKNPSSLHSIDLLGSWLRFNSPSLRPTSLPTNLWWLEILFNKILNQSARKYLSWVLVRSNEFILLPSAIAKRFISSSGPAYRKDHMSAWQLMLAIVSARAGGWMVQTDCKKFG